MDTLQTDISEVGVGRQALSDQDSEVFAAINKEQQRLNQQIELIASENVVSKAVLQAAGSELTNKYAEGYPGRRYYGGCENMDTVEALAIERACELFQCAYANVQPHSGAQANLAAMFAFCKPGDSILGMDLKAGGHLSHGAAPNISGKWFNAIPYGVKETDGRLDYDALDSLAQQHRPKLIIVGGSAYARQIDFPRCRKIADQCGAKLMVDMAHFAGLVAGRQHPSPLPHADVVTTTTHKTLRGPRGGLILCASEEYAKKLNSAVFPGIQGGPLMHIIAAKAVAFGEALQPSFADYSANVISNAKLLAEVIIERGLDIVTGGTDTHLLLVDLRPKGLTGNIAEEALERAGITCNKNAIPFDPQKPMITSGIRLGSPACTSRGFGDAEFRLIGNLISDILDALVQNPQGNEVVEQATRLKIETLCKKFPVCPEAL